MTSLRTKWEKGVRTWQTRARARDFIAAARRAGHDGPPLLVTNLAQMGDVVLCAGVAAALRARHPHSPLLFAGQPRWLEILEGDPALDGLLGAQTFYEVRALASAGLFETVYVLDIPIPDLLHYLDGLPNIFRYAPPTTGDWFTHNKNLMALYEQNAGLNEGEAHPRVWLRPEDHRAAETRLQEHGCNQGGPIFALHTQSSEETKNWPLEKFAALITRWRASHGARFVIVGGPGEAEALSSLPGVTNLAGRLSLKQTAAVIARCDFFVGLDSGLAYMAEAVGTPGLVLLGATTAVTCGPRDRALFSFVRASDACDPACHRVCTHIPFCVTTLEVDTVDRALQSAWERRQAKRVGAICASP